MPASFATPIHQSGMLAFVAVDADPYFVKAIAIDVPNRTRLYVTVFVLADDHDHRQIGVQKQGAPIPDRVGIRVRSEVGINDVLAGRPSEAALERQDLLDLLTRRDLRAEADDLADPLEGPRLLAV